MRQIPFRELDVPCGYVHEWRLVAPDSLDPVLLGQKAASFNQEKHFTAAVAARQERATEDYWVAMAFDLAGPVDLALLERALHRFVQRHEVLRCGFEQLAGDLQCDILAPTDVVLRHTEAGYVASPGEVLNHLEAVFNETISALNWPLFRMGAVLGADRCTVFLAFDHIVCDGISLTVAVQEIQGHYADLVAGAPGPLRPAGSYLDFGMAQRRRYSGLTADDPELAYWRRFVTRAGGFFPLVPIDLGIEPELMYPAEIRTVSLLDDREATAFEELCLRHGGKLFMGVLGAAGIALGRISGAETYHGLLPVSERQDPRWRESFGWFVNTLPISFPVSPELSFPQVLDEVRLAFREMLGSAEVPFVKAWELLAPEYFNRRSWPYPVNFFSFLDFRKLPGAEHSEQWRPATVPHASHTNTGNMWFYRNAEGISLNSITVATPEGTRAMAAYRAAITTLLRDLLA